MLLQQMWYENSFRTMYALCKYICVSAYHGVNMTGSWCVNSLLFLIHAHRVMHVLSTCLRQKIEDYSKVCQPLARRCGVTSFLAMRAGSHAEHRRETRSTGRPVSKYSTHTVTGSKQSYLAHFTSVRDIRCRTGHVWSLSWSCFVSWNLVHSKQRLLKLRAGHVLDVVSKYWNMFHGIFLLVQCSWTKVDHIWVKTLGWLARNNG